MADVLWTCPKCGRSTVQPGHVRGVSHNCPRTRRDTEFAATPKDKAA